MTNDKNKAIIALIIANIIWGAASPIFKLALQNISPFTLGYIRFVGAALLLFPFAFHHLYIDRKDLKTIIIIGVFGIGLHIAAFFLGLTLAPSINAPVIASSAPVFLYIFSILFLHEKQHPKVLLGIFISLLGVLTIVGMPLFEGGSPREMVGNLFFIIAMLGAVIHIVLSKEILTKYHTITITFWSFIIGSLFFLPFTIYEIATHNTLFTIDARGLTGIVFGIFLSSAAAYFLLEWGLKRIEAQEVGLFAYIDPVVATLIAIPLLGEKITTPFLLGTILIFLGIAVAEGRLHYHPIHKLKYKS